MNLDVPLFKPMPFGAPQVTPDPNGDAWQLIEFVNVTEQQRLLFLVTVIACLVPGISHPLLAMHGPEGCGKSTVGAVVKKLIDPTIDEEQLLQKDEDRFLSELADSYVTVYGNLSHLSDREMNILCQACTGGAFTRRKLFTDNDKKLYFIKSIVVLTSIASIVKNSDLKSRTIMFNLEILPPERKIPEADFWRKFAEATPGILGGMFATLSRAMEIEQTAKLASYQRLGDFTRWGFSIAEALRPGAGAEFLAVYQGNILGQKSEMVEGHTFLAALMKRLEITPTLSGQFKNIIEELADIAAPGDTESLKRDKTFPTAMNFRKHVAELTATLAEFGVKVRMNAPGDRSREHRTWAEFTLKSANQAPPATVDDLVFEDGEL